MVRVPQFVLLACISIVSSYTLPKNSQYDLEVPPENQDLEKEDYDAYVEDFIAQLSPEEINILKSHHQINVGDRDGNTENCSWTSKVLYPTKTKDDEVIINSEKHKLQPVNFQICNNQDNYSCKPATNDYHYYGCCIQKKEKIKMLVMSKKDKNKRDEESFVDPATGTKIKGIIEQEVYLDSLCRCEDYAETADDLLKNIPEEEQCKYK